MLINTIVRGFFMKSKSSDFLNFMNEGNFPRKMGAFDAVRILKEI